MAYIAPPPLTGVAPDLVTAVWDVLAGAVSLVGLVGRPASGLDGWLWIGRTPPGYRLPVVLLNEEDAGPTTIWGYERVATEMRSVRLDAFAEHPGTPKAVDLALALRDALVDDLPPLAWESGFVVDRSMRGADPDRIDTFVGPEGRMIQGRRVIVDFSIQYAPRG